MQYAVITYIFGKNKELLREPCVIDKNVEYICVTDQTSLKSKTWRIIVDKDLDFITNTRDKMPCVKYNPFKYTNADKICVIDGSVQITKSLLPLFNQLTDKYDMLAKAHATRDNLQAELPCWKSRGLSDLAIAKFESMSRSLKISLKDIFLYESNVIVFKRTDLCADLCRTVLKLMKMLGENNKLVMTNQCVLSFVLATLHNNVKIKLLEFNKFFTLFHHNTTRKCIRGIKS